MLLHLRHELWKLFGKKRTYIGFALLLLAQGVVTLVFRYSRVTRGMAQQLEGNGYDAAGFISGLTIAVVMLFPIAYLLLPLYVTLVGGDLVAKEVEDGTLRMILARPVSRVRLLATKWLAGAVFSVLLVGALGAFGLVWASCFFPWGGLFVFVPGELFSVLEPGPGLARYALAHAWLCAKAVTLLGLALMFSCFPVKPAAATILALSTLFLNGILMQIPFFRELQPWFLTYHLNLWQLMFAQPVPWSRALQSLSLLAGFNATFFVLGAVAFQLRDFKR